ncbi:hypothetical protein PFICI_12374 [Pestalotiopsis fici W106-1]|uniref:Alpha/beta hydrolase fold-3 domain-containing protein n=1 Tax=Pestalotiopsis fici (strain W106-1 / CGMCC3.15140) TaxID=1229662 RepID=W3WNE1_PESFW|nr:uncharacterized protein PFICI_12374 [Pestalotiopsis fici W106-1]ETS75430.1 hypothetical protein PFICI_12374 [Pestalotiopsis fici W106-1]
MADYTQYGGPSKEWLAIADSLPQVSPDAPRSQRRRLLNEMREKAAAEGMKILGPQVKMHDYSIPTCDGSSIEARSYRPVSVDSSKALPVYYHLHGGGWFFGTLASEDATCARIAINTQVVVFNVNYRHTPEHVYPTAWEDVEDAFEWLHDHIQDIGGDAKQVVMGGVSAGAQLTASFVLGKHLGKVSSAERPSPVGQILMIPNLVNMHCYEPLKAKLKSPSLSSYEQNKDAAIMPMPVVQFFMNQLKIDGPQADDLRLNPILASEDQVKGLPPTVFGIAGWDILRDEGLFWAETLATLSVPTDVHLFPGLPHGFRRAGDKLAASERWDKVMENGITWALSNPAASGKFDIQVE